MSKLTKGWSLYIPEQGYEKEMQDIKLFNGDIITMCWANAGMWTCCRESGNEQYYGRIDIKHSDAQYVRLTHDPNW